MIYLFITHDTFIHNKFKKKKKKLFRVIDIFIHPL